MESFDRKEIAQKELDKVRVEKSVDFFGATSRSITL
jgi:hypothetical protein